MNQGEASTSANPLVDLITPAVQLVMTRSRARADQWTEQDNAREQARQWVEVANANQAGVMSAQAKASTSEEGQASTHGMEGQGIDQMMDISDMAGIRITMTLEQLLRLVPRFHEGIRRTLGGATPTPATTVQLTEVNPRVMDCDCPSIHAILDGQSVPKILIDGGSGVNVINVAVCQQLGITKWEPCMFWLRMADGSSVRPVGIIPELEMVVQGHAFTISVVIMYLPSKEAYPLLLGRP